MLYPSTCHKLWTQVVSPFHSFPSSQLLSDIEDHLKCTITQCEPDLKIPVDEFDGKVTYGQRRALGGTCWTVAGDDGNPAGSAMQTTFLVKYRLNNYKWRMLLGLKICFDWTKWCVFNHSPWCAVASSQVGTTRVTSTFWPRQSVSWRAWREKPRAPSFTWDTCPTSFSKPSEDTTHYQLS